MNKLSVLRFMSELEKLLQQAPDGVINRPLKFFGSEISVVICSHRPISQEAAQ